MPVVEGWFLVATLAAGAQTTYAALQKRLTADVDTLALSYVTSALGVVFLAPIAVWSGATSSVAVTPAVVGGVVVSGAANVAALYTYLTALERADLSVVAPLRQSTPVFVAGLEPLVLATGFEPRILLAATAVVAGGYVVLTDGVDLLTPLRRLQRGGPALALATAGLFAVASVASRFVVVRMPPLLYTFVLYAVMASAYFVLTDRSGTRPPLSALRERRFLAVGAATSTRSVLIFLTFSLVAAAKATVVLRLSVLLNVLVGVVVFEEAGLGRRLAGAGLLVAGVALAV